jgi:predicted NACHT family NTPase
MNTKDELQLISNSEDKPIAIEGSSYPLEKLSSRNFEILLYNIYKLKIDSKNIANFDQVTLMQGIAERGRDLTLYTKKKVTGLIQCKHSSKVDKRYNSNEIGEEITKFILHYLCDSTLITDIDNFQYIFATNTDISEDAQTFLLSTNSYVINYPHLVRNWVKNNLKKHKKLNLKNDPTTLLKVQGVFSKISISKLTQEDINIEITKNEETIAPRFFKIKTVADNSHVDNILNLITTYIKPKLDSIIVNQEKGSEKLRYAEGITKYLKASFENYSYVRTIVFGNNKQKLEDLYVPLTLKSKKDGSEFLNDQFNKNLLDTHKKVLISSSAGMGKSTFAKNLFLQIIRAKYGIPIFIELRRLTDKNSILGEIVNKLKPLYGKLDVNELFKMIEKGHFIFILDGFDEIEDLYKEKVIQKLNDFISKTSGNNFLLTSRPETALASFADFQEFEIKDLTLKEAFAVLAKYGKNLEHSNELISKLKGNVLKPIEEFLKNPLLVSLLYKAYEYKRTIPYKKHLFYAQVFDALFEHHDLTKDGFTRQKKSKLDIGKFDAVLRYVAYKSSIQRKSEYLKSDLEALLVSAQSFLGYEFSTSEYIKDLVSTVPLFTLEGNYYNWSHKSLQDYFSARFIQMDSGDLQTSILLKIYQSPNCDRFDNVLDILYEIDYKAFRNVIIKELVKDFFEFSQSTYTKYDNVNEDSIRLRKSYMFKRKVHIMLNNETQPPFEENLYTIENIFTATSTAGTMLFTTLAHYQNYFVLFLARKSNKIAGFIEKTRTLTPILDDSNKRLKFKTLELSDEKDSWPNQDYILFEQINQTLKFHFSYNINALASETERNKIEQEQELQPKDDLLRFD